MLKINSGIIVAIALLAAIALGVWFYTSNPASSEIQSATTTPSIDSVANPTAKPFTKTPAKASTTGVPNSQTTYKSLLTQNGSYQCDYNSVTASGQTTGVIYIYNGKMRGEFRTQSPGESISNFFVYDGHYMYQWKEGRLTGVKTVLTSLSQLPFIIPKDLTSGAIIGSSYENIGWNCHTWLTNKSLLTPPSYVTFN